MYKNVGAFTTVSWINKKLSSPPWLRTNPEFPPLLLPPASVFAWLRPAVGSIAVLLRDRIPEIADVCKNAVRIGILARVGRVSRSGTARLVEIPADRQSVEPRDRR